MADYRKRCGVKLTTAQVKYLKAYNIGWLEKNAKNIDNDWYIGTGRSTTFEKKPRRSPKTLKYKPGFRDFFFSS